MLNYLWGFMIIIGTIFAAFTGNLPSVTEAALDSAKEAVMLCITMIGVMSFWVGLMKIAERAGLIEGASKKLEPLLTFLFPSIPKDHKAREYISTNMIANFFGLGWAATPAGIKAMEELEKLEDERRKSPVLGKRGVPKGIAIFNCQYFLASTDPDQHYCLSDAVWFHKPHKNCGSGNFSNHGVDCSWSYFCVGDGKGEEGMKILLFLSDAIIPLLIFSIVGYGLMAKQNVYDDFIDGAKDGFHTVIQIMPTLIGLMIGVGILRASGFLDFISKLIAPLTELVGFPSELVPVTVVKMFSSSAATGLVLDIFKEYGTDSLIGTMTSLMMSSTETIFYTMSVYFMAVKVSKSRWTLAGALLATLAGTVASVVLAYMMV